MSVSSRRGGENDTKLVLAEVKGLNIYSNKEFKDHCDRETLRAHIPPTRVPKACFAITFVCDGQLMSHARHIGVVSFDVTRPL